MSSERRIWVYRVSDLFPDLYSGLSGRLWESIFGLRYVGYSAPYPRGHRLADGRTVRGVLRKARKVRYHDWRDVPPIVVEGQE